MYVYVYTCKFVYHVFNHGSAEQNSNTLTAEKMLSPGKLTRLLVEDVACWDATGGGCLLTHASLSLRALLLVLVHLLQLLLSLEDLETHHA